MKKLISKYYGILRRLRITYWLFNIFNLSALKQNKSLYKKHFIEKPLWQSLAHTDIKKASNDIPWMDKPEVTNEQIQQKPSFNSFSPLIQNELLSWPEQGYMIISKFFEKEADSI